jgi:hypothetical protein
MNVFLYSLSLRSGERVGVWGCFSTPIMMKSAKNRPFVGTAFRLSACLNKKGGQKMNTKSPKIVYLVLGIESTNFRRFMAKICILLFFSVFNSKLSNLLIVINLRFSEIPNRIQREIDSNVAIRTFESVLASKPPRQKTNLFKPSYHAVGTWIYPVRCEACCHFAPPTQRRAVTLRRRYRGVLSLRAADGFAPSPCEAGRVLGCGDTSRRRWFCSLSLRSGERVGVWGYFAPPIQRRAVTSRRRHRGVLSRCAFCSPLHFGEGLGVRFTNQIQREFLFNNCIQSHRPLPASKHPRQKTNVSKQNSATEAEERGITRIKRTRRIAP